MICASISRRAALQGGLACLAATRAMAAATETAIAIEVIHGQCLVPVSLDGRMARMLLDTGAERSVMSHTAAKRVGLRADRWVATTLRGAGGQLERFANVDARAARAGGIALMQNTTSPGLSLPVTTADLGAADGLLGSDILRHYEIDLDPAEARLSLRLPNAQPGPRGVTLQPWRQDLLLAPVMLDGHPLTALVDTGSTASLLNARGSFKLALASPSHHAPGAPPMPMPMPPGTAMHGIGGIFAVQARTFAELRVGSLVVHQPPIVSVDVPEAGYDMILGFNILGRQRLVLSYAAQRMALG
jgi:predicted aspartyl protease